MQFFDVRFTENQWNRFCSQCFNGSISTDEVGNFEPVLCRVARFGYFPLVEFSDFIRIK
jgi:hypothetical protein